MIFGNFKETIFYIYKILQENWFFAIGKPYWLVDIIWMPNKDYMFPYFFNVAFFLRISLPRVPMYMFFENIINWRFSKITYVDVGYIKMVVLVLDQTFQFY
jgi:hypothetical protein